MRFIQIIYILLFCFLPFLSFGQTAKGKKTLPLDVEETISGGCGADALLRIARKNPAFKTKEAQMNREILSQPVTLDAEITLPVVFHIIEGDSIPTTDLDIINALNDLNDAFSKSGNYASSNGVDTKIRFCLAKKDPEGGITTGITRTRSFFGNDLNQWTEDARVKNLVEWDPLHYINIWYVKNIHYENYVYYTCSIMDGTQWRRIGTQGYATMPPQKDSLSGIVVSTFGPILAHEMGHYLGLYHTFEGGCGNNDCQLNGDRVCDTPPDGSYLPSSCSDPTNSCRSDTLSNYSNGNFPEDVPDQVTNFMDYSNFNCSNQFTQGQAIRMRAAINAMRSELLLNKCNEPCPANITASFTRDIDHPLPGNTIQFANTSVGANKYEWLINDVLASTNKDFSFAFNSLGKYKVTLKAYSGSCFASSTDFVIVTCGVTARFFPDKQQIASKTGIFTDSVMFTNLSENASSYKWLIRNDAGMAETVVASSKNLIYIFPSPGNYQVRLIATNGICADTTETNLIPVDDPTPDIRPRIISVDCYQQNKLRVEFNVCNSGYKPIPQGIPISFFDADPRTAGAKKIGSAFFLPDSVLGGGKGTCCSQVYTEIIDVKRPGLDQLYIAVNDDGSKIPINISDNGIIERNYDNNVVSAKDFAYHVTITPTKATLEPGDTIQLTAAATPITISSTYTWQPAQNLSCTSCATTILIADSTTIKQVIAKSDYDCIDSAFVTIEVPPAYDYTISIDTIECSSADSMLVNFTVYNNFKRDFLPKGLPVSFYDAAPTNSIAKLLPPVFTLPNTLNQKQASFSVILKGTSKDLVYAVVNDSGTTIPLKLPNTSFAEKKYDNNSTSALYTSILATASSNTPVCASDTIKLQASSNTAGAVFSWSGPNGFTSTEQNPVIISSGASDAGSYKVTASKNGCTSSPANTAVVISINPQITATLKSRVCENGTIYLTATNGASRYSWSGPDSFSSSLQNPVIPGVNQINAGNYTVTATSANNCISAPSSVKVSVNSLPKPKFSAPDICLPSTTVAFSNESTIDAGSINSYLWNFGDATSDSANTSTEKNPVHTFPAAGRYNVSLRASSDSGCIAKVTSLYTGIHNQPTADFTSNQPSGVCAYVPIVFTDKSASSDGTITKWTWETGSGHPIVQNDNTSPVTVIYEKGGTYTVSLTVTNDFGCEAIASKPTTVFSTPVVNAGPDLFILDGGSTILQATASGNGLKYLWTPSSYLSNPSILTPSVNRPTDDILYGITVTNSDGCVASDQVWVKILRKLNVPNAFSPNGDGINDVWNIRNLSDYPGCIVDVFDRYGKQVFHSVGYNKPWDGTRNGGPTPVGVYYYIITPKNGVETVNGSVTLLR